MILVLLHDFLIDFIILGLSWGGYLLRPHFRRFLAAGKARVRQARAYRLLAGLLARSVSGPAGYWTRLSRWRMSRAKLKLLQLGHEIESFTAAIRQGPDLDDGGEVVLEPWLVAELATAHCFSKRSQPLAPMAGAARGDCEAAGARLDSEFVSRDDPVICSVNWIDVDVICYESAARADDTSDPRRRASPATETTSGTDSKQVSPVMRSQESTGAVDNHTQGDDDYDDCSDHVTPLDPAAAAVDSHDQLPSAEVSPKSCCFARGNKSRLASSTAGMRAPNEALNNSARAPESGEPPDRMPAALLTERPSPAAAKVEPNDDCDDDVDHDDGGGGDGDGPRRRRSAAEFAESHLSVAHEDLLVDVRGVWSGTNRELIMLQYRKQQQQQQQQGHPLKKCDRDGVKGGRVVFCLVKFCTEPQLIAHHRRASLIFYLIQLHPKRLAQLFGLVSALLERAGLLCASGFWCHGSWPGRFEDEETSGGGQPTDDWLELIGWELGQDDQWGRAGGRERAARRPRQMRLMDRYALLLMVAAYLERERSAAASRSGGQIGLASSLVGFLECYSSLTPDREATDDNGSGNDDEEAKAWLLVVRNGHSRAASASNENVRLEIEFVSLAKHGGGDSGKTDQGGETELAVLDPTAPVEWSNTCPTGSAHELARCEANLTGSLTVWREVRQLFADSLIHLRLATSAPARQPAPTAASRATRTDTVPILAGLNKLARRSRSERRRQLPDMSAQIDKLRRSPGPSMAERQPEQQQLYSFQRDGNRMALAAIDSNGKPVVRANTITGSAYQSSRTAAGLGSRLKAALRHARPRKLGRSILFLVLFVTIRLVIFQYLIGLQRDIMHGARDDFIALKRMVFPEGLHGLTEDEEDDAGDGISILTREERRQRAEREAAAVAAAAARRRAAAAASQRRAASAEARPDTSRQSRAGAGPRASEHDNGRDHEPQLHEDASANSTNKVAEALLAMLMSQALGGDGGTNLSSPGEMDAQQLQELMRMLEGFDTDEGDAGSDDDEDYEDFDDDKLAKLMAQMQSDGGLGPGSATGDLGNLMGSPDGHKGANIDSGAAAENHANSHHGDEAGDGEDQIWPGPEASAQSSGARGEL